MKIKEKLEDFVVSEIADIYPEGKGEYSLYMLKKLNISTWDALGKIAKKLRISMDSINYGGLKDKKAIAHQFITIKGGPKRDIKEKEFELIYLGKTTKPMSKDLLIGNKFEIIVRDFQIEEKKFDREVELVRKFGLSNYFNEQRFGSIKSSKEFAAKEIILGNYERALYLMMAEGSAVDIEKTRKFRDCLKKHWGNFEKCLEFAKVNWEKNLLNFLITHKPSKRTFKRALNLVDKEYLFFLGNAYQSYLWNEVLKEVILRLEIPYFEISYLLGKLFFYKEVPADKWEILKNLKLPLPSPKLKFKEKFENLNLEEIYNEICKREGLDNIKNLRSFIKGLIFKTYPRPAVIFPEKLEWEKLDNTTIKIKFTLEKGAYATLVVKRLCYGYQNP
ncbi:tRNA pseudouridine synthase D TruD [Thermodesulfobacterium geofontis OPF15]|jgi:tRNA pseudouridine13 synthase|uniref:tRNA pseudouridine synthase D TruD n=1 Tax=Thermodesulfobacterium geofontis (strain OPF15) TaxID=795359 RepID=F8C2E9_THEGP|nr:tRNA pseudouridine(13) synthase TruD [Thermodesulfobacterium geofontis]AEH22239.1 tRNA pseudouridine synthase D TruD [Thermodesulfobacterium geofontis OPF15]